MEFVPENSWLWKFGRANSGSKEREVGSFDVENPSGILSSDSNSKRLSFEDLLFSSTGASKEISAVFTSISIGEDTSWNAI